MAGRNGAGNREKHAWRASIALQRTAQGSDPFQNVVVVLMRSDPEPHDDIPLLLPDPQGPIRGLHVIAYVDCVDAFDPSAANFVEVELRIERILSEDLVAGASTFLDGGR